jgi:hypothetical protein
LAAVNIDLGVRIRAIPIQIVVERLSGDIRECLSNWPSLTCMTLCANLDIPVTGESRGIHNRFYRKVSTRRLMARNMFTARSVTPLAGDTQHEARQFVMIVWLRPREGLRVGSVTLQAARTNRPIKVRNAITVTRTVDPLAQFDPVRHRKLKKPIALPEQIGLPFSS